MYICTTTSNVRSPNCFHNRERCSAVIAETSALNCSANSATTASASDAGSPPSTQAGKGAKGTVCAHTRRTRAVMRPSPGDNATNCVSISHTLGRAQLQGNRLLRLAHRRHVEVWYPQRRHGRPGGPVTPFPRQGFLAHAGLGGPPQQVQRALVEAEVVDRRGHLAVLDEVDAVAGQSGEQQRGGIDLADVPQCGEQQATFGGRDDVGGVGG